MCACFHCPCKKSARAHEHKRTRATGKQQRSERRYTGGKQGRDALGQARLEAEGAARKKMRLGYAPLAAAATGGEERAPLPMLATDWLKVKRPERLLPDVLLQPKLDGIRCVADTRTGALFSRTGSTGSTSSLRRRGGRARPLARWSTARVYRHGASFQGIGAARHRQHGCGPARAAAPVRRRRPVGARRGAPGAARALALAARGLASPGALRPLQAVHTEAVECASAEALRAAIEGAVRRFEGEGYEGAIARAATAQYTERKRSLDLVKAKRFRQEEFAVERLEERPKQPGVVATVRCRTADGQEFGATPECTHAEKQAMWARRSEYEDGRWVATVRFQELSDGGVPRFPVCAGLRHPDDR